MDKLTINLGRRSDSGSGGENVEICENVEIPDNPDLSAACFPQGKNSRGEVKDVDDVDKMLS